MKVIVCGAGQVGTGIARRLSQENNDITVIDHSPELIRNISQTLDVKTIIGHASHPDVLQKAGAQDADMLIAVTLHDEVNMVACQVCYSIFSVPTKIARVRSQNYLKPEWHDLFSREHAPVDVIISPEIEAGDAVLRRLALPGSFETFSFVEGKVTLVGVTLEDDCPVVNTPLRQLTSLFPNLSTIVTGVVREGKLFIPHSDEELLVGDDVFFISATEKVKRTLSIFGHEEPYARHIIIIGGGNIGRYVAQRLEETDSKVSVRLIEQQKDRAMMAAKDLDNTIVLHGSGLEPEILREAGAMNTETVVTLTNNDQVNILASVMAHREGCQRTLCLINDNKYAPMMRSFGIDVSINPRTTTISSILQHVRRGRIKALYSVADGMAEVVDAEVLKTSPLLGMKISEIHMPEGIIIGAIVREGQFIMPSGDLTVREGDRIIVFAHAEQIHKVEQMFRVSFEYF
ncbi:MAG: Trk system potassium transporter TrkA [Parvularculales bacterium]